MFDFLMVYTREQYSSDPSLKTKLKDFIDDFRANWCKITVLKFFPKCHILAHHVFPFLDKFNCLAEMNESLIESPHATIQHDMSLRFSNQNRSTTTRLSSSLEHSIFKPISLLLIHYYYYDKQVSNDLLGLINLINHFIYFNSL